MGRMGKPVQRDGELTVSCLAVSKKDLGLETGLEKHLVRSYSSIALNFCINVD